MKSFMAIAVVALLSACGTPLRSDQAEVNFTTNPLGARITTSNTSNYSTATIVWTLSGPVSYDNRITATWPSGTTTWVSLKLVAGESTDYVFQHPGGPGLAADLQVGEQIQQKQTAENVALVVLFASAAVNGYLDGKRNPTTYQSPAPVPGTRMGYQTRDALGNLVNSRDSYQTKDWLGNLVNSRDNYQTRDYQGNLVNSRDAYLLRDANGKLVSSKD